MKLQCVNGDEMTDTGFRVPALEKGLDIIEALANQPRGLMQKDLAGKVDRSASEIFRVLGALEARGYIVRDAMSGEYRLSLYLHTLTNRYPPLRNLLDASVGPMKDLASAANAACHVVTMQDLGFVVMAQSHPDTLLMGWSVKVGGTFPMSLEYASACAIAAFQPETTRAALIGQMDLAEHGLDKDMVTSRLDEIRSMGFAQVASKFAPGIVDVSCPILDPTGTALAAITVSVVGGTLNPAAVSQTTGFAQQCAEAIRMAIFGKGPVR
jgi:DNA-binding IclR family transcriptional regulator